MEAAGKSPSFSGFFDDEWNSFTDIVDIILENDSNISGISMEYVCNGTLNGILIWASYNDLTATSLEMMINKGNHPQMALIQVSESF